MILKSPRFVPFGANLALWESKPDTPSSPVLHPLLIRLSSYDRGLPIEIPAAIKRNHVASSLLSDNKLTLSDNKLILSDNKQALYF